MWGKIAADQDLPVPEIQSGCPELQMDRGIMHPYAHISHREWWQPVSGTDGISAVSRFGSFHIIDKADGRSLLKISPACNLNDSLVFVNDKKTNIDFSLAVGQIGEYLLPFGPSGFSVGFFIGRDRIPA